MDANALKQLSRAELQKLAKGNNIKANGKSQAIIEQLIKKCPEGVPKVAVPVPRASSRPAKSNVDEETKQKQRQTSKDIHSKRVAPAKANTAKVQEKGEDGGAQTASTAGMASMATPDRDIEIIPTTPTVATESSKGVAQDMDPNKKMSNTHTTNRDIAAPVTKNSEAGSDTTPNGTDTSSEAMASGLATPEVAQQKGPRTSTGQSASSPNRDTSRHGYRFGQPSASITGRRIAGGGRVSRYLATPPRVSATQVGNGSSSSPQLATPDALAKLVLEGSVASHEKPLSRSSRGSSGRRRNIPAPDRHDGSMENSRTPQSGVSSSSSFPNRETPSPAPEREGATEAQAKAMLCALRKKVGELNYWRNELASAQYVLKQANERNKAIQEKIVAVQKHRKVAERFYMAAVKKDERLHNGAKTWKPQEPGQPERDYSYVAEESEEQDTSDFVADSDESRPSGSLAENAEDAVDGEVKVGDEQQDA